MSYNSGLINFKSTISNFEFDFDVELPSAKASVVVERQMKIDLAAKRWAALSSLVKATMIDMNPAKSGKLPITKVEVRTIELTGLDAVDEFLLKVNSAIDEFLLIQLDCRSKLTEIKNQEFAEKYADKIPAGILDKFELNEILKFLNIGKLPASKLQLEFPTAVSLFEDISNFKKTWELLKTPAPAPEQTATAASDARWVATLNGVDHVESSLPKLMLKMYQLTNTQPTTSRLKIIDGKLKQFTKAGDPANMGIPDLRNIATKELSMADWSKCNW